MKIITLICLALALSGCGSISSLAFSDKSMQKHMKKQQTKCNYLPHVYGGVAWNFCFLHAEPKPGKSLENAGPVIATDFIVSGVIDTLALPYTVYMQNKYGSIPINK